MRLALAVALALSAAACRHAPAPIEAVRESAYKATVRRLDRVGTVATPPLERKVVLVSFFATWCFPCLVELPALQALHAEYSARDFTVVLVGLDIEEEQVLSPFAEHYQLPFPVLIATEAVRNGNSPYGVIPALPTNFLLGRDGEVRAAWAGIARPEQIAAEIEKALAE